MSAPQPARDVKPVASILAAAPARIAEALADLAAMFGKPDFVGAVEPFAFTAYYASEMGSPLWRRFVSFEALVPPESLPEMKTATNRLEEDSRVDGRRRINIDPGYIALPHLILATGKGYTHRPYLRDGIYADLTLVFRAGSFQPLPWTYPDYAREETIGMMNRIRAKYVLQLHRIGGTTGSARDRQDGPPGR